MSLTDQFEKFENILSDIFLPNLQQLIFMIVLLIEKIIKKTNGGLKKIEVDYYYRSVIFTIGKNCFKLELKY